MTVSTLSNGDVDSRRRSGLSLLKSPFKLIGARPTCRVCRKKCSGQVLRVNDAYFHNVCFKCHSCDLALSTAGFFTKDDKQFCTDCYQSAFGTRCGKCNEYVEGEVVSALGQTYCQRCFTCASCDRAFAVGEKVTFNGKQCICQSCIDKLIIGVTQEQQSANQLRRNQSSVQDGFSMHLQKEANVCSVCNQAITDGHALVALDKKYHLWCFRCTACNELLHGEYMGKEGQPFCERCYQARFGIKCTYCRRYISGKVLQAGDNNHFHPTCARCTKCGEPFGDGQEMFLQGAAIWHPECGPGPDDFHSNGDQMIDQNMSDHLTDDRASIASHYSTRASTPGLRARSVGNNRRSSISRSTAQIPPSYPYGGSSRLYNSNSTYSLRRPIEPGDRVDSISGLHHFHLPPSRRPSLSATRQAANSWAMSSSRSLLSSRPPSRSASSRLNNHFHLPPSNRALSCPPPKPGYTHQARAASAMNSTDHERICQPSGSNNCADSVFEEHRAYPIHLLLTSNFKLPPDVDRCNLEMHLSDDDFKAAFRMARQDFYAMPLWRRNDLKRRVGLF